MAMEGRLREWASILPTTTTMASGISVSAAMGRARPRNRRHRQRWACGRRSYDQRWRIARPAQRNRNDKSLADLEIGRTQEQPRWDRRGSIAKAVGGNTTRDG